MLSQIVLIIETVWMLTTNSIKNIFRVDTCIYNKEMSPVGKD